MSTSRWTSSGFADELRELVTVAVGSPRELTPVRVRPWSTVWRAVTGAGTFYAKENCTGQRHEAALLQRLGEVAPGHAPEVVAADPGTGLFLTRDLGPTLRERGGADLDGWCAIVARAAELQRTLVPHAGSLGLTAIAPADAPDYAAATAFALHAIPDGDPRRLDDEDYERVVAALPELAAHAARVAALDLPLTLNHNDLHDGNVLVGDDGRLLVLDLGDAVLTEPLGMLRVPLAAAAEALGAPPGDPRLDRVADAALEHWTDLAPVDELRAALPSACHLARLARVESWLRCVASMDPPDVAEHGGAPARWVATLAEHGSA